MFAFFYYPTIKKANDKGSSKQIMSIQLDHYNSIYEYLTWKQSKF